MKSEDIKVRATKLTNSMNKITAKFKQNSDFVEDMDVDSEDLIDLVQEVIAKSDNDIVKTSKSDSKGILVTPTEALNLSMLIEDFGYVRTTLKSNADDGRRILSNVTSSILVFDDADVDSDLVAKADLIKAFSEVNKSVAVNLDLYLKTYKEISTILVQLDKIKDTTDSLNDEKTTKRDEKVVNTSDLIKSLNDIEED